MALETHYITVSGLSTTNVDPTCPLGGGNFVCDLYRGTGTSLMNATELVAQNILIPYSGKTIAVTGNSSTVYTYKASVKNLIVDTGSGVTIQTPAVNNTRWGTIIINANNVTHTEHNLITKKDLNLLCRGDEYGQEYILDYVTVDETTRCFTLSAYADERYTDNGIALVHKPYLMPGKDGCGDDLPLFTSLAGEKVYAINTGVSANTLFCYNSFTGKSPYTGSVTLTLTIRLSARTTSPISAQTLFTWTKNGDMGQSGAELVTYLQSNVIVPATTAASKQYTVYSGNFYYNPNVAGTGTRYIRYYVRFISGNTTTSWYLMGNNTYSQATTTWPITTTSQNSINLLQGSAMTFWTNMVSINLNAKRLKEVFSGFTTDLDGDETLVRWKIDNYQELLSKGYTFNKHNDNVYIRTFTSTSLKVDNFSIFFPKSRYNQNDNIHIKMCFSELDSSLIFSGSGMTESSTTLNNMVHPGTPAITGFIPSEYEFPSFTKEIFVTVNGGSFGLHDNNQYKVECGIDNTVLDTFTISVNVDAGDTKQYYHGINIISQNYGRSARLYIYNNNAWTLVTSFTLDKSPVFI